ncbi:TPA: pilus assembly protein PilP [Legionella pneumophila]|uniref:pilus assembly protein PilP n=1 Tax=Legionella pneumophila TaxID=446 RepID=UPI0007780907|nr:pilus assembly protein PilP [Legionella pneumophila]HAT9876862.1 pilus assembly protein PilP [Legionella pneumophila subsp. pneumophila]HAT8114190.1 pilus assembly protein PilP [Legionella pneumophila]HAT8608875.1 pilus assembly protein PilP [Legionella pneumophila]HAU2338336.1 pilus assembly protein PilP [Legionella pneumophila]HAU2415019.1 pilus assembly protein PilP [Legionella pneumophila]
MIIKNNQTLILGFFGNSLCTFLTSENFRKSLLTALLVLLLSACSGDNSDLVKYINEVKSRPERPIEPIPKFAPLPIFRFPENDDRRNPFKPIDQKKRNDIYAPDKKRPKQPLESFPLDALKFVGTLKKDNEIWALIRQPDGQISRVRVGDYMGQNYGRIILIKNDLIKLEETVQKSGTWEKQSTTINLDTGKQE